MTLLEMTLNAPGFKAYCRRRIDGHSPTMAEHFTMCRKERQAEMRAFFKRRGISSIFKAEKGLRAGQYDIGNGEIAQLTRIKGEITCIYNPPEPSLDAKIAALLEEQNRLLALLRDKAA